MKLQKKEFELMATVTILYRSRIQKPTTRCLRQRKIFDSENVNVSLPYRILISDINEQDFEASFGSKGYKFLRYIQ